MADLAAWHRRLVTAGPATLGERLLCLLLLPCGWLYAAVGRLRWVLYRGGVLRRYRAPVPVISVGNLEAGGTGKTPVVDYLVKSLQRRGLKVAVVSRGYGGKGVPGDGLVCAGDGPLVGPEACGDEPYLLARRNPGCLVLVAPRRSRGIAAAVRHHGAQVVVLDDGFQHLAVARDLDIVLLDARHPLGNGRVLPAGRLRESPAALARADLLLLSRDDGRGRFSPPPGKPLLRARHELEATARELAGDGRPLADLRQGRGLAFAGIARPEGFFSALEAQGVNLAGKIPLADHAAYDFSLRARLEQAAAGLDFLVTTEKDGVKLEPGSFSLPCYQVGVAIRLNDAAPLEAALERCLHPERP